MTENEAIKDIKDSIQPFVGGISLEMAIQALEEIQQYRAIETVEKCREAVERMKPKKIVRWADGSEHCPSCDFDNSCIGYGVCIKCGQAIDWSK